MRVTEIQRPPGRRRAHLYLDGRLALTLSPPVLAESGLKPGDEVSAEALEALRLAEARHTALASALRLLSYRPRSEAEVRQRLAQRGIPPSVLEETVARLRELALLDDEAFARSWVESRQRTSPRGRQLLARELRAKGVERETAQRSLAGLDEEEAAYRAVARRAPALRGLPYRDFQRRLGDFLLRRGFSYETARRTVRRLWEEGEGPAREAE